MNHSTPRRIRFWLHSETHRALMVHTTPNYHSAAKREHWLPLSQIEVVERTVVKHPDGDGRAAGAPLVTGTLVTLDVPEWLLARKGLTEGAQLDDLDLRYLEELAA